MVAKRGTMREEHQRIRKMGWTFLILAAISIAIPYFTPTNESNYWLSTDGKEGFFALSGLFIALGLYSLGSVWRRKYFI